MNKPVRLATPETRPHVDRETYLKQGYVIVRGALDIAALAAINTEISELFAVQLRRLRLPVDGGAAAPRR
ncbi:MAG TPA: hypothetical protein VHN39_11500, partial [Phenylobacterium sp.]|nr:hypothetical protein [Phenylobacterium sp.]